MILDSIPVSSRPGRKDPSGASVLNALSAEERKVQAELEALSAEESRIQLELNCISAGVEERRAASRESRPAGHGHSQQPSPMPNLRAALSQREAPLRSKSDWTDVADAAKSAAPSSPRRPPASPRAARKSIPATVAGKCLPA